MSKTKRKQDKLKIDGLTITHNKLQYSFNGWACGYGKHGKSKYSRKVKHKHSFSLDD